MKVHFQLIRQLLPINFKDDYSPVNLKSVQLSSSIISILLSLKFRSRFCSNLSLQQRRLCDRRPLRRLIELLFRIISSYFSQLSNAAFITIEGRWRPLLSILAVFTRPTDLHHSSLLGLLIHPVLFILVEEVLRLHLVLTIVSGQATLLCLQIERLDDCQLFLGEKDLIVWTRVLIEFRHGACLEEFFG